MFKLYCRCALLALIAAACSDPAGTDGTTDTLATDGMSVDDGSTLDGTGADSSGADAPVSWTSDGIFFTEEFVNLAHRGGGKLRPEHTLEAYTHALTYGLAAGGPDPVVLELDLRPTADGVPISMHDGDVDRTTDGEGSVADMTLQELKQLDAGYDFTADGGKTFPWRGKGLTVPTLDEALARFPDAVFTVEIKRNDPPIVDKVLAAFAKAGALNRTIFASFNDLVVQEIRSKRPDALTALDTVEMIKFTQLKDADMASYEPPAPFAIPPWDSLNAQMVARMHAAGVRVHTWTVNSAAIMHQMLDIGVDGIFSDDPKLLAEVRAERLAREGGKKP